MFAYQIDITHACLQQCQVLGLVRLSLQACDKQASLYDTGSVLYMQWYVITPTFAVQTEEPAAAGKGKKGTKDDGKGKKKK